MLLRNKIKGYVSIPNGKVDVTDPCYDRSVWCRMNDIAIRPGDYRCRYYMGAELEQHDIDETTEIATQYGHNVEEIVAMEREDIKHRCFVLELQLKGRAFPLNSQKWKEIGEIGVDAGLAGFFWNKPDFKDDEWSEFCDSMDFEKVVYLDKDMGFWSTSGYGDGCYGVYAIKEDDEIIALKICF